jgi:hypothetical protein
MVQRCHNSWRYTSSINQTCCKLTRLPFSGRISAGGVASTYLGKISSVSQIGLSSPLPSLPWPLACSLVLIHSTEKWNKHKLMAVCVIYIFFWLLAIATKALFLNYSLYFLSTCQLIKQHHVYTVCPNKKFALLWPDQ